MAAFIAPHGQALADPGKAPALTAFGDLRARWESGQSADDASIASASARIGVEAAFGENLTALAEVELAGRELMNESISPQNAQIATRTWINRAQLSAASGGAKLTLGRQTLSIGDERFVGASSFAQNQQTFDAFAMNFQRQGLLLEAYNIWRVPGADGFASGGRELNGQAVLFRISAQTPAGWASAYRYDLEFDALGPTDGANSITTGMGLEGQRPLGEVWLSWRLDAAQQEFDGGDADYARIQISVEGERVGVGLGQETLGARDGFAFQTPLGSKRAFQGFAGNFSTTPPQGVRDTFMEVRARFGNHHILSSVGGFVRAHRFQDGGGDMALGQEINAGLAASIGAHRVSVDYAIYDAKAFGADTRRVWLTVAHRF